LLALSGACRSMIAQGFSGDARKIGMGGIGYSENITADMINAGRPYRSIVLPLGLVQLIQDRDKFNPDNKNEFDPILALEYAANPIHYVFGRDPGGPRGIFVHDIITGNFSRDLNTYRGFVPTNHLLSEGLANPNWGKTFKFRKRQDGSFQGFYTGVGPYISAKTDLSIDQGLTDFLASASSVFAPSRDFRISDLSTGQLALSLTGGYRARFALSQGKNSKASSRDGIYVAANYNYLWGFGYEQADLGVRLSTDAQGLVTLNPTVTPVLVDYYSARSGKGFSLDFGIGVVIDRWEFGFGANGVENRIKWEDLALKEYTLDSLFQGGDFIKRRIPLRSTDLRVELPTDYIGNVGYHTKSLSAVGEVSRGFQGTSFHGGVEYRLGPIEFRGGGRYALERWHPSGGIGFNLGERFSIDLAGFGTTTNIEREMRPGFAVSLRFNRRAT
jgi:hypothetical protein